MYPGTYRSSHTEFGTSRQMIVQYLYVCLDKLYSGKRTGGSGELLSSSPYIAEEMTTSTDDFG